MSRYQVTSTVGYRGYQAGETFEAYLEPAAERRALTRGNIRIVEQSSPALRPARTGSRTAGTTDPWKEG